MRHSFSMTLLLLVSLWALGPAAAQPAEISPTEKAQVEAFSKQGVRAYREARYGEAIGYFRRAFTIFPEPKLLFNLGRCHQKRGEFDEAIDHFAQVVGDTSTHPALRERAQSELEVLVAARQMTRAQVKAVEPTSVVQAPVSAPQASAVRPPPAPRIRVTRIQPAAPNAADETTTGGGHQGATWTLVGIGSATLIAGTIFYALGVGDHRDLEDAKGDASIKLTRADALALRDDGANRKTAGVTLLSISGAALLSAMVLFLSAEDDETSAGLQVGPMGNGIRGGWGGRF